MAEPRYTVAHLSTLPQFTNPDGTELDYDFRMVRRPLGIRSFGVNAMRATLFGDFAGVITALAIAFAVITSINATIVVGGRTTYACAHDWPALKRIGRWDEQRQIPAAAIWTQGAISLALVVFATWKPWRVLAGAYLFGGVTLAQFQAQASGLDVPAQFLSMLPYLATIVVLVIISRDVTTIRLNAPASLGKPFHAAA